VLLTSIESTRLGSVHGPHHSSLPSNQFRTGGLPNHEKLSLDLLTNSFDPTIFCRNRGTLPVHVARESNEEYTVQECRLLSPRRGNQAGGLYDHHPLCDTSIVPRQWNHGTQSNALRLCPTLSLFCLIRTFKHLDQNASTAYSIDEPISRHYIQTAHLVRQTAMNSDGLRKITIGLGPGSRGDTCLICLEPIKPGDSSSAHDSCQNTFHRDCFDHWAIRNYMKQRTTTCPACREDFVSLAVICEAPPYVTRATSKGSWYDYDMRVPRFDAHLPRAVPTAALLHRLSHPKHMLSGYRWLSGYLIRQARAHPLLTEELRHEQFCKLRALVSSGLCRPDEMTRNAVLSVAREIKPGEIATDFEIVSRVGKRRPRLAIVDLYSTDLEGGRSYVRQRLAFTRRNLCLSLDGMYRFQKRFETAVFQELNRLRRERQHRLFPYQFFRQQGIRQYLTRKEGVRSASVEGGFKTEEKERHQQDIRQYFTPKQGIQLKRVKGGIKTKEKKNSSRISENIRSDLQQDS
jgi:Ring finger domain